MVLITYGWVSMHQSVGGGKILEKVIGNVNHRLNFVNFGGQLNGYEGPVGLRVLVVKAHRTGALSKCS